MAVIQISKIQVRRGKKNSESGVPQLSSAEFAWAVDSQELFIGNGSVAEGAPYVGNTKILTEHDDILSLSHSYTYGYGDASVTNSVSRTLQSKLDEYVSLLDYGPESMRDGTDDCTVYFQNALDDIFRNATSKKTLVIPNGTYYLSPTASKPLSIPSGAIIKGETEKGSIINISSATILTETIDGLDSQQFSSTNRPVGISISNLTIQRTTGSLILTGVANSVFESVRFRGSYELGDTVSNLSTEPAAIYWNNSLAGTATTFLEFKDCMFDSTGVGIHCQQSLPFETRLNFRNCKFFVNHTSVYIEGVANQINNWHFTECEFLEVASTVFISTHGGGTLFEKCGFKNCGSGVNTSDYPEVELISFGESSNNVVWDCNSDRQQLAGIVSTDTGYYITEVTNGTKVGFLDRNEAMIYLSDSGRPLSIFSASNTFYTINYRLELSSYIRQGVLSLSVDKNQSSVSISDHYQYSPNYITSPGGTALTNFEFSALLKDNNDSSVGNDTIVLYYTNPLLTGYTGYISFDVAYGV